MNKQAFYGYLEFFDNSIPELDEFENDDNWDLLMSLLNGCYRNYKFAEKCKDLEITYDFHYTINAILISNNSDLYNKNKFVEFLYHDFNYASYENCKLYIHHKDLPFMCVLNDWKDLYEEHYKYINKFNRNRSEFVDEKAYSLALYLNKQYFINHQKNLKSKETIKDNYFIHELNSNIREHEYNLFYYHDITYDTVENLNEIDYIIDKEEINTNYFTKYNIVNNFDIAYKLYERGDRSNLVLSKLITMNPYKFKFLFKKYKPFLIYCREYIDPYYFEEYLKIEPLCKYNLLYNNIISNSITRDTFRSKYIDIPEYNLYIIAKKLRNKEALEIILKLYKEHGKLYKIMDLENEKYVNEEIIELPQVENLDLFKGDELNPYN